MGASVGLQDRVYAADGTLEDLIPFARLSLGRRTTAMKGVERVASTQNLAAILERIKAVYAQDENLAALDAAWAAAKNEAKGRPDLRAAPS